MIPPSVRIADLTGQELDEAPFETFEFTDILNDTPSAKFTVAKSEPKAAGSLLTLGQREVHIYLDGALAWGGRLWTVNVSKADAALSFEALGYFSTLDQERFYDDDTQIYTGEEQQDIAWDLIAYSQAKPNGDLGVTRDPDEVPSGITRDLTINVGELPMIGQTIRDLAGGTDGFDWWITPDKVWHVSHPERGQQSAAVIELGKNIQDYALSATALGARSTTAAAGTNASGGPHIKEAVSAPVAAAFGLLEGSTDYSDIRNGDLLQDLADDDLVRFGGLIEHLSVELSPQDADAYYGAFGVGDRTRVRIAGDGPYIDVDDFFRVESITVSVEQSGQQKTSVDFDQRAVSGVTSRRRVPRSGPTARMAAVPRRLDRLERIR